MSPQVGLCSLTACEDRRSGSDPSAVLLPALVWAEVQEQTVTLEVSGFASVQQKNIQEHPEEQFCRAANTS